MSLNKAPPSPERLLYLVAGWQGPASPMPCYSGTSLACQDAVQVQGLSLDNGGRRRLDPQGRRNSGHCKDRQRSGTGGKGPPISQWMSPLQPSFRTLALGKDGPSSKGAPAVSSPSGNPTVPLRLDCLLRPSRSRGRLARQNMWIPNPKQTGGN